MEEKHRLALTLGGVIDRALEDDEGLQSSDYSTYQVFEESDLVFKLIDLENIKTSRVGYVPRRGIMSPAYIRLQPSSPLTFSRYYYWFFYGAYLNNIFNGMGGGVRQNLTPTDLLEFPVPLPDLDTQKAIADFLDRETARIDELIDKRSKFAELVLERRLAIVSQAVTGTTGDTPWLSALPDGWKAERAKVHFRESQERSKTGEEELLTVSHLTGVTKRSEKDVNMFMAESNEGYKLVAPGELVINTMWAWMGAMGVSSEHGLISPSYGIYSPISDALRSEFVDLMVRSKPFIAEATRRSKGIHSSRLRLYPDAFLDMRLPIPPLETQDALLKEIANREGREDNLLEKNKKAEALLQEFRSALITAAVTGQINVKNWGRQEETDRRLDRIEEEMSIREVRA
ncbi:hypothetical protein CKO24_02110 [Rhodothalassium salexigens DSM 2132]|nr:restriction endonuclease subunit S [Rhodothalassium salexigens]MBK1637847.1 hypothetical protein [Rhodothalassium salexigens DSM 2132]